LYFFSDCRGSCLTNRIDFLDLQFYPDNSGDIVSDIANVGHDGCQYFNIFLIPFDFPAAGMEGAAPKVAVAFFSLHRVVETQDFASLQW
jgi:hypothetical protein